MRYLGLTLLQMAFVVNLYAQQNTTQGLTNLDADNMVGRYEVVTKTSHDILAVNPNNAEVLLWSGLSCERLAGYLQLLFPLADGQLLAKVEQFVRNLGGLQQITISKWIAQGSINL